MKRNSVSSLITSLTVFLLFFLFIGCEGNGGGEGMAEKTALSATTPSSSEHVPVTEGETCDYPTELLGGNITVQLPFGFR